MKNNGRFTFFSITIFIVLLLTGVLRLNHLDGAIADWHSWRQADTAAVARNFEKLGFDPFRPRYDDLSNIQTGKDNPLGLRMVEFPLYQSIAYAARKVAPIFTIEVWLRLVNIIASIITVLFLIVLFSALCDKLTGVSVGLIYAVLPYSVYYGRAILPENLMVCLSVITVYCVYAYTEQTLRKRRVLLLICATICGAAALLVKPVAVFLFLPIPYLLLRPMRFSKSWVLAVVCMALGIILPLILWRKWISQFPEGIPVYQWLFNEGNIRFKGAWFNWLFAVRIGDLILGYWGLAFLGFGFIANRFKKEGLFLFFWIIGLILYFIVLARGNVQHDYYQIVILPVIAAIVGKGLAWLVRPSKDRSYIMSLIFTGICMFFMLMFSWYTIRGFFWINHPEIVEAGKAADRLLPKDAKVIAPYGGDTSFLYQTNRQGWPIGFEIGKKIKQGATHYVTVAPTDNDDETKYLASHYKILVRTELYAIIDLRFPTK